MSHSKFANNRMDANGKKSSSSFVSSRKSVKETKVAVVGGGLVGSMMACFLAKRGYKVELFEMRKDPRKSEHVAGKSINLALSERGRSALRLLGLEEEILQKYSIRMYSRMIHEINGRTRTIPYGTRSDEFILSVGRRFLNELLLTEAEKYSNVSIKFEHKLIDANLRDGQLKFNWEKPNSFGDDDHQGDGEQKNQTDVEVDVILGCDGAYSAVRRHMIKLLLLDYSQKYIEHGYLELCIPPTKEGDFAMPPNHLHIWPRDEFMMIALPNLDRSFTVTLFMPFKNFEMIQTETDLLDFFRKYFNDSIPLLTRDGLCQTFFNTKPSPLISIKCRPYNFENKALLMGDAAHAMVPFYGQGMNCGFEDCLELDLILEQSNKPLGSVLGEYTTKRVDNCHAIIDLAMYNYIEMRALVNRKTFLLRKSFDNLMHRMFPNFWTPLYSMVTFSRTPYHKCIQDKKWQDEIINRSLVILAIFFAFLLYIFVAKYLDTDSMILGRSHFHK
ncbi:kynurenine 3-monooxygenase-like protein [Sarcoptes scabiei]|uniref:Kynurenine 3-monooxygenase n=1 Tax=Sarcoptes scabiei TaxID=52283 RepID=A0A132AFB7_SARSC|nr:kynurenine 3-monooxygenase-like protein [Sarcoptes scabiei]